MIVSSGQTLDIAPQALGETVPSLSNGYFYPQTGLELSGKKFATYAALYRAQPSIATLVDKIASSGARLSFRVWDNTPATGKVEDSTSAFARLLARPTESMSAFNFWRWTFSTYEIYGEAFWLKSRDADGVVISLLPMHPSRTEVRRDQDGATFYVFSLGVASAGLLTVAASEVVPFLRYNPESLMRGMSRLEPLRSTLLNEDAARRATESWWLRGARPSVALKHPGELSAGAQERLRANWEARHAGADLMGGTAILEEGMEAQIIQLTADEMQYIESRKMNLQEACMVFDVPPPVVHVLDHATYSNITEQMRSMYRDTMSPRLEDFESVIDHHLRPDFFAAGERAATFALDEVLRGDFETRATAVGNLIEKGVMKPSEARPLFDLPDAGDAADRLYGNAALVPLGSSVHGQTEVNPAGDLVPSVAPQGVPKPIDSSASVPKSIDRNTLARLGRIKAFEDVRAALVEHHTKALGEVFDQQAKQAATQSPDTLGDGWDDPLANVLHDLGVVAAKAMGNHVAKALGGSYELGGVADWLREDARKSARNINGVTLLAIKDQAAAEPDGGLSDAAKAVFAALLANRLAAIALSRVNTVGGLASLTSAAQNGAGSKTWVTGGNPRSAHASMNGETVGINDLFSNGMNAPGDPSGGADQVAGCNCSLDFG